MPAGDETDFKFLAENSADIICRSGMDRVIRYTSPSCFLVLGWKPEEMIGKGPMPSSWPRMFLSSMRPLRKFSLQKTGLPPRR